MKNNLTLGSLFDGSGGFPLGGMLAGITPLWASEIEPFAVRVTTKRLPQMEHYGDVSSLNGVELPPVDIITFGSPCQDMSIAGKRSGLDGERSSLFYEAVRIIKEMRCATNGKYPRFAVWENVPGAFSSNKGDDFRCVLESLCRVKDESVSVPQFTKWTAAGNIVAEGFSLAWRVLDAQYWGVPQRRKRIYLVTDFDGECADKILFESESVSGYSHEGFKAWQRTAATLESGSGATGTVCLNDQGGERIDVTEDVTCTLRAEAHHPPCVIESASGFCTEHSSKSRSIGYEKDTSPTLRAGTVPAAVYENHSQDTHYTELHDIAPTVSSTYGTGGNNQPFVVENTRCFDVRFTSEGTKNARQNCYETDTARTIDTGGNHPDGNQGGVAVVAVQGSMIGRADKNGPQGSGVNENVSFTLNATDRHAVVYSTSKNSYHTEAEENLANTLVATDYKDPPTVNSPEYIVRRLTPTECARLQGFPDWWCSNLGTDEPADEELAFWKDVFETRRKIVGNSSKPKSEKQIIKWLKNPHSDSAEYKLWGNGVALPCVYFVLAGIAWISSFD